jgi:hypothetical protein
LGDAILSAAGEFATVRLLTLIEAEVAFLSHTALKGGLPAKIKIADRWVPLTCTSATKSAPSVPESGPWFQIDAQVDHDLSSKTRSSLRKFILAARQKDEQALDCAFSTQEKR